MCLEIPQDTETPLKKMKLILKFSQKGSQHSSHFWVPDCLVSDFVSPPTGYICPAYM